MVEETGENAILAGTDGVIQLWPSSLESVLGYNSGEAVGRRVDLIVPHALRRLHWRGFDKAMTTGRIKRDAKPFSTVALHKSGRLVSLRVLLEFAHGLDGAGQGVKASYLGPGPRALVWISYPVLRLGEAFSKQVDSDPAAPPT